MKVILIFSMLHYIYGYHVNTGRSFDLSLKVAVPENLHQVTGLAPILRRQDQ
jgi:hypothetical protein